MLGSCPTSGDVGMNNMTHEYVGEIKIQASVFTSDTAVGLKSTWAVDDMSVAVLYTASLTKYCSIYIQSLWDLQQYQVLMMIIDL